MFLVCLALAITLWFFNAFTKNYDTLILLPVKYVDLPSYSIVTNDLPEFLRVEANTHGFNLLMNRFAGQRDTLEISIQLIREKKEKDIRKKTYFVPVRAVRSKIGNLLGPAIKINAILTDTIFFEFDRKVTKEIRVKPVLRYTLPKGYLLEGLVAIHPPVVSVTGPAAIVDTLTTVFTQRIELGELTENISKDAGFDISKNFSTIRIVPPVVNVNLPVGKIIEDDEEIIIVPENAPKSTEVKLTPARVTVYYQTSSLFKPDINDKSFTARVNMKETGGRKSGKVKIEITKTPPHIKVLKLEPAKAEYVIVKKK